MNDSFFYRAKQTVYKWWCVIYKPVYKLVHHGYWPAEKEPYYVPPEKLQTPDTPILAPDVEPDNISLDLGDTNDNPVSDSPVQEPSKVQSTTDDAAKRAQEILDRLNKEAAAEAAKKQAEIEIARKKADEDARVASILKSTQHDISQYINEGMANREHHEEDAPSDSAPIADDETLRRAQEIMDRLNREAAEDEAKKQAEIEAAKEYAKQHNL